MGSVGTVLRGVSPITEHLTVSGGANQRMDNVCAFSPSRQAASLWAFVMAAQLDLRSRSQSLTLSGANLIIILTDGSLGPAMRSTSSLFRSA